MRGAWTVGLILTAGCTSDSDGEDDHGDTDPTQDTDDDTDVTDTGPQSGTGDPRVVTIVALEGEVAAGSAFYDLVCQSCHAEDGTGQTAGTGYVGADFTLSILDEDDVVATVLRGIPDTDMDEFHPYPNQDLADVTTYVFQTFIQ